MGCNAIGDFGVTLEALKGALAAQPVTCRTIRGPVQGLVSSCERAGRDLPDAGQG